jgi:hypothetical protein
LFAFSFLSGPWMMVDAGAGVAVAKGSVVADGSGE